MSYALITGASKGIGKAISEALAKRKVNLLLSARSEQLLKTSAEDLKKKFGIDAQYFPADLSLPESAAALATWCKKNNFPINILVNNAGYGLWGDFMELTLEEQLSMLHINTASIISLTHLLLPELIKNTPSYILNIASTTAYQAIPRFAVYSASKTFIVSFSRALNRELKKSGVSVTCLSPGTTDSGFIDRARMKAMEEIAAKFSMPAETVAEFGVKAMFARKKEVVPGFSNVTGAIAAKFLPKDVVEGIAQNLYRKR
ncbi:MAG: SDR family NAD(P)-dependent oxidoreductase [Bacteroidia bacterium]